MGDEHRDDTPAWPVTPGGGSTPGRHDLPDRIGPYKILQVLGSGGMGVVYMAEQTEPVQRRVALKVVKLGMDTKEVMARFEAERQALALMDHPSIARVYEAGATDTGRPYFAMELVKGVPFTEYCDKHKLRTRQRVELVIEVCRAVQHAHQKGVIHRDLKPTNVLVTIQDDRPVPKIIDFGIAKAMDRRLTDRTLVTELGAVIGTPDYMSPEQLEASGLDVDTRTDIFSLGVMLYVVLTGMLPREVQGSGAAAVQTLRTVEEDLLTPSARVARLADAQQATIAANRHTEMSALRRELRGDLDWITLKAMARNRTERYEAASGLALDLQRYLRNEPIAARPPSARYRMGKFIRRHRAGVAMAAAAVALLLGFAVAMALQATRVAGARDRAEREAARATALNRFMTDMLGSANPWGEGGKRDVTIVEALQKSADKVDQSFANEPLLAATARQAIGTTFAGLGHLDAAEPLLQHALEARKAGLGPTSPEVAETLQELAALDRARGGYDAAVKKHREGLAIREKLDGPDSEPVAEALTALTQTLYLQGEYDEAEKLGQRALDIRRKLHGQRSAKAAASLHVLAKSVSAKGDYARAEDMQRECLAIQRETRGPETVEVAQTLNDLAVLRLLRKDLKEAEALYRESLALSRKILGEEHPEVASNLENLGGVLFRTGREKETLRILDEVLAIRKKGLGEDSLGVARTLHNRSVVQSRAGEMAAAEAGFRESVARLRQALGADHPEMAQVHANYARLLRDKKDYTAAEKELRESLAIAVKKLGPEHVVTAGYELDLGHVLVLEGRFAEAEPLLRRGFAAAESGSDTRNARRAAEQLVEAYRGMGRPADVETYRQKLTSLQAGSQ